MKKLSYLIVLTLILGLVLTGCLLSNVGQVPTSEPSGIASLTKVNGSMTVVSDTNTMVTEINNVDVADQNAVLCWVHSGWWGGLTWSGWFGAQWIWDTYRSDDPIQSTSASITGRVVRFERTFNISDTPTAGTLHIAVDNGYEVWLNGQFVGTDNVWPLPPSDLSWRTSNLKQEHVDWTNWQTVGNYNVSGLLQSGTNTLVIIAGNEYMYTDDTMPSGASWPRTGGSAEPVGDKSNNPGGVVFQLDIDYEVVIEEVPGIEVVKECPPAFAYVGDTLTYNYTVTNTGDGALLDVTLVDDQLGLITLTGLTDADSDLAIDDLAEGASATGTDDYVVLEGDTVLLNTATASSTSEIDDSLVEATSDECMVEICYEETAFGGETVGLGKAWWFYFDTSLAETQTIWAGQHYDAGTVTVSECIGDEVTITIELADGWYLQDDDESVKIQGYDSVPSKRQPAGKFETYKGDETEVGVPCFEFYIIHLDVQHCGEFEFEDE